MWPLIFKLPFPIIRERWLDIRTSQIPCLPPNCMLFRVRVCQLVGIYNRSFLYSDGRLELILAMSARYSLEIRMVGCLEMGLWHRVSGRVMLLYGKENTHPLKLTRISQLKSRLYTSRVQQLYLSKQSTIRDWLELSHSQLAYIHNPVPL